MWIRGHGDYRKTLINMDQCRKLTVQSYNSGSTVLLKAYDMKGNDSNLISFDKIEESDPIIEMIGSAIASGCRYLDLGNPQRNESQEQ